MAEEQIEITKSEFTLSSGQRTSILIVCFLLYMINFMDKQVMSVVLEPMKQDLGLSDTQAGMLQTIFFLGMAFFGIPVAFLVDRWSRRKALASMAIIWSIFTYVTGLGKGFYSIAIARFFVGVGEAAYPAAGTAMLSAAYPQQMRGRVLGIFNIAIPIGASLGMILGGVIVARTGSWRSPFFVFAIPGIILGICAFFLKDYQTVKETDQTGKQVGFLKTFLTILKIPTAVWFALGYSLYLTMNFVLLVWGAAFYMRCHNVAIDQAAMIMGSYALLGIIGAPAGGIMADIWQKKNPKGRVYAPLTACLLSTVFLVPAILFEFIGIGFLFGAGFGIAATLGIAGVNAVSQDIAPPAVKGITWGVIGTCAMIVSSLAPSLIGIISDAQGGGAEGLKTGMLILCLSGLLGAIMFWKASKHYPSDMEKVINLTIEAEKK